MNRIKAVLRYGATLLVAYFIAWTAAYIIIMYNAVLRLDFSEYLHWFVLAWTFRGFEMVASAWLLSLVLFVPVALALVLLVRRWAKSQSPAK